MCGLTLLSTVISAGATMAGAMVQSQGIKQQAEMAAAQSEMQAKLYRREAQMERAAGSHEAANVARQGERLSGAQRAGISASGLDISSGSAMEVQIDSAKEVQRDVDAIRWNSTVRSDNSRFKARMETFNAGQEREAGKIAAMAPLIQGAASVGSSFFSSDLFGGFNMGGGGARPVGLNIN